MNYCPICQGTLISKTSSSGSEVYCNDCRNVIVSSTLNFRFAFEDEESEIADDALDSGEDSEQDSGGGPSIEQCYLNGLPGWKSSGEKSRCYTYSPGSQEEEDRAKQKATESAYMETREAHVKKLADGMGAPFTRGTIPGVMGLGTVTDEFGTTVQFNGDLNNNSTSIASRRESSKSLSLDNSCSHSVYCSDCGVTH